MIRKSQVVVLKRDLFCKNKMNLFPLSKALDGIVHSDYKQKKTEYRQIYPTLHLETLILSIMHIPHPIGAL